MVALWRGRFLLLGIQGLLKDAQRPGRTPRITAETVAEVVAKTTQTTPSNATQWSTRTMARAAGISEASVRRIWHAHGLKPHRNESFKISRDPEFAAKLDDVVGLYLNPPEHALVLSVDEKSQIQALDRTQPGLPMKKGRGQTMTHDYKRNGTTTLFAALNTATGEVYHLCQQRHRHHEWLKFLRMIDQTVPADRQIHIICDNYGTHKHERVQRWMARHKRFHAHFTPTSASWLNMVERFFRDLTENRIRRGVFKDLEQLIVAIGDYIDRHNQNPKPFIWTAKANDILEKVTRAQASLNKCLSVSTFFESDGLEWQVIVDLSCKNEALRVAMPEGTKGLDELKTAALKGRRGTLDKTITATFVGIFKWVPDAVPLPYRALVVSEIRDLRVKPGPSPFLKAIGVVGTDSVPPK